MCCTSCLEYTESLSEARIVLLFSPNCELKMLHPAIPIMQVDGVCHCPSLPVKTFKVNVPVYETLVHSSIRETSSSKAEFMLLRKPHELSELCVRWVQWSKIKILIKYAHCYLIMTELEDHVLWYYTVCVCVVDFVLHSLDVGITFGATRSFVTNIKESFSSTWSNWSSRDEAVFESLNNEVMDVFDISALHTHKHYFLLFFRRTVCFHCLVMFLFNF